MRNENVSWSKKTPLQEGIAEGDVTKVNEALKDATSVDYQEILMAAVISPKSNPEVVKAILDKAGDTAQITIEIIRAAIAQNNVDVVKLLLERAPNKKELFSAAKAPNNAFLVLNYAINNSFTDDARNNQAIVRAILESVTPAQRLELIDQTSKTGVKKVIQIIDEESKSSYKQGFLDLLKHVRDNKGVLPEVKKPAPKLGFFARIIEAINNAIFGNKAEKKRLNIVVQSTPKQTISKESQNTMGATFFEVFDTLHKKCTTKEERDALSDLSFKRDCLLMLYGAGSEDIKRIDKLLMKTLNPSDILGTIRESSSKLVEEVESLISKKKEVANKDNPLLPQGVEYQKEKMQSLFVGLEELKRPEVKLDVYNSSYLGKIIQEINQIYPPEAAKCVEKFKELEKQSEKIQGFEDFKKDAQAKFVAGDFKGLDKDLSAKLKELASAKQIAR